MKFFVTTPIYYVNDIPHIGHAYTTLAADVLSRFNRLKGNDAFFLTGTDEHGQKVQRAAEEKKRTPKGHADLMVENYKRLWEKLNVRYDGFIRTTDEEHIKVVQELLSKLYENKLIEKRSYSGWYCTPDERFWTEKDLIDGKCPDCGRDVERIEEENYFFLMSKYRKDLIEYIKDNPDYILPETRKNEVMGFLNSQLLGDLCISRPKKRLSWGIELPFDKDFVTYVWFDALVNYYSATKYLAPTPNPRDGNPPLYPRDGNPPLHPSQEGNNRKSPLLGGDKGVGDWWPADVHLIGKDILTTHAVYWSTMLMALDLPLPKHIFAHGWWTVEGKKMSKSLGNVVDPAAMADKYGADAFRYFLFREVPFGHDGDFSEEALIKRTNTDLANDLGNLLSRTLTMIEKYRGGMIPEGTNSHSNRIWALFNRWDTLKFNSLIIRGYVHPLPSFEQYMDTLQFDRALAFLWSMVNEANKYIEDSAPWKEKDEGTLSNILYTLAESLYQIAVYVYPFMPSAAQEIWTQLGVDKDISLFKFDDLTPQWGNIKPGTKIDKGKALFPRIETPHPAKIAIKPIAPEVITTDNSPQPPLKLRGGEGELHGEGKERPLESPSSIENVISIDDFSKVQLKTGIILHAERVPKSKKLIRLEVDTGERRQVVAGIGDFYGPEELVGKSIVVVTNLKPAKLMGVESQGMLLAATDSEGKLSIIVTDKTVLPGAKVK